MVAVYNNISMVDLKWCIRKKSKVKANKIILEGLFNGVSGAIISIFF